MTILSQMATVFTFLILLYFSAKSIVSVSRELEPTSTTIYSIAKLFWDTLVVRWENFKYWCSVAYYWVVTRFFRGIVIYYFGITLIVISPFILLGIVVYLMAYFIWDVTLVPILQPLTVVFNILIEVWNAVGKVVRIVGLSLPSFDTIGASFPTVWDMFVGLFVAFGKLLAAVIPPLLKGTIIR